MNGDDVGIRIVNDIPASSDLAALSRGAVLRVNNATAAALILSGNAVQLDHDQRSSTIAQ